MPRQPEPTVQQSWQALAAAVRQQLHLKVQTLAGADATDASLFVDACRQALLLEQEAECFDKTVEVQLNRAPFGD